VHDAAIPLLEEGLAGIGVGLIPELDHLLLVGPGLGGAQVGLEQVGEVLLFILGGLTMQPPEAGPLKGVVAFGGQL